MKINNNILKLISLLEYKVGSNVYNPNSYDGWSGKCGCSFRYPVTFEYMEDDSHYEKKTRWQLGGFLKEENLGSIRYKFGSNHLYIGDALVDVLDLLEKRYDLDFDELEQKVIERKCESNE